jgi:hypothetical protein
MSYSYPIFLLTFCYQFSTIKNWRSREKQNRGEELQRFYSRKGVELEQLLTLENQVLPQQGTTFIQKSRNIINKNANYICILSTYQTLQNDIKSKTIYKSRQYYKS